MSERKYSNNPNGKMVEPDQPPIGFLSKWFIILSAFFVGGLLILVYVFYREARSIIYKKDLSLPSTELLDIKKRDEARLTTYEIIDKEKGIYQIPIDEVINHMADNPELLGPIKP